MSYYRDVCYHGNYADACSKCLAKKAGETAAAKQQGGDNPSIPVSPAPDWQRRAAERIGRMACSCDDDACIATYAERIIREESADVERELAESHANAVCALMTAQAENTRLKDDLGQAVILLRRFEAGDNYFAADCRAFLARHGGER